MSRYRPPRTAGTPLITPEGAARLRAELHELWHVRRPQVTQAVSEAAALGDRSENAEYIYGKKMLREIDSRVRFLRKRLENLKVVGERPADPNRVYFSSLRWSDDGGRTAGAMAQAVHVDFHAIWIDPNEIMPASAPWWMPPRAVFTNSRFRVQSTMIFRVSLCSRR